VIADDTLVIGFGGNLAGVLSRFVSAREALAQLGDVRSARLYRTAPIGPPQPPFFNTAVRVRYADGTAPELLATVLEIELMLGRDRDKEVRNGPRKIDLDILVWGTRVIRTPELEIPHPRLAERRFALQPLADLVGEDAELGGRTIASLLARVAAQSVELVNERW
jgi:2-amino-4-hydroxy-6-hydroxymethyldihydropteridine diphosphokinase